MDEGTVVAGRFEIESIAGKGGMGVVYRCRDRATGEPVALKILDGDGEGSRDERFAREAKVLADLRHPAIVGYVADGVTEAGQRYLALAWLDGQPLHRILRHHQLHDDEALRMVARLADGLDAAHHRGIIHRDIKPSNIFLVDGRPEQAMLLDFGVARLTESTRLLTQTGMLVGTPSYMSPEQARRGRELDTSSDIFSLGAVLFQCLTGQAPYAGDQIYAILAKVVFERPPRVSELRPDVSRSIDRLVARMMSRDPQARPPAGDVARAIAALSDATQDPADDDPSSDTLTDEEQRLVSVVFAHHALTDSDTVIDRAVTEETGPDETLETVTAVARPLYSGVDPAVAHALRPFGARLERLRDGSLVAMVTGGAAASDLALRAGRAAIALRGVLNGASMALATGRALVKGRVPVGEVIDRAASLVRNADGVALDEVTAALLPAQFDVRVSDTGIALHGEFERLQPVRTLLGKPTPCVGRERDLEFLLSTLDECIDEPMVHAVVVTGPAGIGKSRLRYELVNRIRRKKLPVQVLIGRGDPMSAGAPFGLIAHALRRAIGVRDDKSPDAARAKLSARVGRHVPREDRERVVEFLGELLDLAPSGPGSIQLRTARRDPVLMGDQIRRAWEDWLRAECQVQPVLLVLEDLHWGDLPTVRLLDGSLRALAGLPFMVLALARPDVHELFPDLWGERGTQEIRLGPLRRTAARELVRATLGQHLPNATVDRIVDHAGGNAFFLEELIRSVDEDSERALPETVLAMVQARLQELPPEARRILRAASVFGPAFWESGLHQLLGDIQAQEGCAEWLAVLEDRELVTRREETRFPGHAEYAFRHAFVCEAAYGMLTEEDRKRGHRGAGAWLQEAGESDAGTLGAHFERGGDTDSAAAWYRRAAEQALEGNDFEAAVGRAMRGIECGATGELLGELELVRAKALRWAAASAQAAECAYRAMADLPRGSASWCAATQMVGLYDRERDAEIVDILCNLESPHRDTDSWVIAVASVAARLFLVGRPELGNRLRDALGDLNELRSDDHPELCAWLDRMEALWTTDERGRALHTMRDAARNFERAGDIRNATMNLMNVGFNYCELGAYADGERVIRQCLERSQRLGSNSLVSAVMQNLGFALVGQGTPAKLAEGVEVLTSSIDMLTSDSRLMSGALGYLAIAHLLSDDLETAETSARAAVDVAPAGAGVSADADAILAEVLLARGHSDEALTRARTALTKLAEGEGDGDELYARLIHAEALHATGAVDDARRAIAAARERLMAEVATIDDPVLEQTFLDDVRHHRRIVERANEWGA